MALRRVSVKYMKSTFVGKRGAISGSNPKWTSIWMRFNNTKTFLWVTYGKMLTFCLFWITWWIPNCSGQLAASAFNFWDNQLNTYLLNSLCWPWCTLLFGRIPEEWTEAIHAFYGEYRSTVPVLHQLLRFLDVININSMIASQVPKVQVKEWFEQIPLLFYWVFYCQSGRFPVKTTVTAGFGRRQLDRATDDAPSWCI